MFRPPLTTWLRALRDAAWVVLGLCVVAYLLVAGYGEGAACGV